MDTTLVNREETLVLVDQQGTYYAIPRDVVERYRATDEQKVEIESLRGDDVSGYGNFGLSDIFIHEQTIGGILAERREEASRERMAREAITAGRNADVATGAPQPGFINVVAAFIVSLTPGTALRR